MRKFKFEKGKIYHIFNRGVEKREIFKDDNDRWRFLQGLFLFNDKKTTENLLWQMEKNRGRVTFGVLKEFFVKEKRNREPMVRIMADCLMPNHYHLLLEEIEENGISKFMQKLGTGYARYFNNKYNRVGSLFQGTFKAVSVEEETYLEYLLIYINVINPGELVEPKLKEVGVKNVKKIMRFADDYSWGTHQEYGGKRESIIIEKGLLGEIFPDGRKYRRFAEDVLESKKWEKVKDLSLEN
jgi:putative transposase